MTDIVYKVENLTDVWEQVEALGRECWNEVDQMKAIFPYDLDKEQYDVLTKSGHLRTYTLYDSEEMVGFAVFQIGRSLHSKGLFMAISDSMYIRKGYRGEGKDFLKAIKEDLRTEGVDWFTFNVKAWLDNGNLAKELECTHYENVYQVRL